MAYPLRSYYEVRTGRDQRIVYSGNDHVKLPEKYFKYISKGQWPVFVRDAIPLPLIRVPELLTYEPTWDEHTSAAKNRSGREKPQ